MNKHGYLKDTGWIELEIKTPNKPNETIEKMAKRCIEKYDLRIINLKKRKDAVPYIKKMFELLNVAYKDLYGVVPITEKQMEVYTKQYFSFVNPDYISFVVDKNDELAAFGIILPSLSKALQKSKGRILPFGWYRLLRAIKKNKVLDLYLVAVRPELQKTGVTTILLDHLLKAAIKNNVEYAIASPELETNKKVQSMWRFFDKRIHRRRTCFKKAL